MELTSTILTLILRVIGYLVTIIVRISKRSMSVYQTCRIKRKGRNCYINGPGYFSYSNIVLGNNVYIGVDSTFMASDSQIIIGDNVVFGPHCFIIGGNHRYDVVGKYIKDVHEKRAQDDADIVIGEDCWIGANAIILKGAEIGRGCVIGAGSIVTKKIPPYTIFTNKGSKPRFSEKEITEHELILNKES